ncbi:hypothetical protein [Amycolatopsis sp. NPDC059021]|uniref:hypothetical protein n=1 Tax=Amycolatopsis sp. NPDC059021 TaxID=3346704 RepID=UPI0036713628
MSRALSAEWLRLRGDYVLLGCLGFVTFTAVASVVQSSGGGDPHQRIAAAAIQTAVMAALYGAIRFALEHRDGVFARCVLLNRRGHVLRAKVVTSAVSGAVIGLYGTVLTAVVARSTVDTSLLWTTLGGMAASAFAASWGLLIGSLVRHYVLAPLAALVTLLAAIPVLSAAPAIGRLLPLGGQLSLAYAGASPPLPVPAALAVLAGWLLVLTVVAERVLKTRDVL